MDIIFHVYNREMADMANTNPLFFSELSKYSRVMKYLTNKTEKDHKEALDFVKRGIEEGYFVSFFDYNVVLNFISFSTSFRFHRNLLWANKRFKNTMSTICSPIWPCCSFVAFALQRA